MTTQKAIDRFLEDQGGRYARFYFRAIQDLYVAIIRGNEAAARDAKERLQEVTTDTMAIGEVLGATLTLKDTAAAVSRSGENLRADRSHMLAFAETEQNLIPRVTFEEAVQDMIDRTPATIRVAAERTGARIAELYSSGKVVAFAKAAEESVTKAAQDFIVRALREGIAEREAGRGLVMSVEKARRFSEPWSESYAKTVFRTNLNTAVTAGKFRQSQDPVVKAIAPAFRYDAVGDADTRPNHNALDGMVLRTDNPAWVKYAPPNGYQCRCSLILMNRFELRASGHLNENGTVKESNIPADGGPDEGFKKPGRPDLLISTGRPL